MAGKIKKPAPARRARAYSQSLYAPLSERLLSCPEMDNLTFAEFGLYAILLARSDVYGCLQIYSNIMATMGSILATFIEKSTSRTFRAGINALHKKRLIEFISHRDRDAILVPHKLPSQRLQYYAQPRVIPAGVVVFHVMELAKHGGYLSELVNNYDFDICLAEDEAIYPGNVIVPEWLHPAQRAKRRTVKPVTKAVKEVKKQKKEPQQIIPLEIEPPKKQKAPPILDSRVIALQRFIQDNGFDIEIEDKDLLHRVIQFGSEYVQEMIMLYGVWRLDNPTKAKKHKSHHLSMNASWVHERARFKLLPNPNDEWERVLPNVVISKPAIEQLIEAIKTKTGADDKNARLYLQEFATNTSGYKRRMHIHEIKSDANYILSQVERYNDRKK